MGRLGHSALKALFIYLQKTLKGLNLSPDSFWFPRGKSGAPKPPKMQKCKNAQKHCNIGQQQVGTSLNVSFGFTVEKEIHPSSGASLTDVMAEPTDT